MNWQFLCGITLESLEEINNRPKDAGVQLHMSEVKGPVMGRLKRSDLLDDLTGEVFLTQFDTVCKLDPDCAIKAMNGRRTS